MNITPNTPIPPIEEDEADINMASIRYFFHTELTHITHALQNGPLDEDDLHRLMSIKDIFPKMDPTNAHLTKFLSVLIQLDTEYAISLMLKLFPQLTAHLAITDTGLYIYNNRIIDQDTPEHMAIRHTLRQLEIAAYDLEYAPLCSDLDLTHPELALKNSAFTLQDAVFRRDQLLKTLSKPASAHDFLTHVLTHCQNQLAEIKIRPDRNALQDSLMTGLEIAYPTMSALPPQSHTLLQRLFGVSVSMLTTLRTQISFPDHNKPMAQIGSAIQAQLDSAAPVPLLELCLAACHAETHTMNPKTHALHHVLFTLHWQMYHSGMSFAASVLKEDLRQLFKSDTFQKHDPYEHILYRAQARFETLLSWLCAKGYLTFDYVQEQTQLFAIVLTRLLNVGNGFVANNFTDYDVDKIQLMHALLADEDGQITPKNPLTRSLLHNAKEQDLHILQLENNMMLAATSHTRHWPLAVSRIQASKDPGLVYPKFTNDFDSHIQTKTRTTLTQAQLVDLLKNVPLSQQLATLKSHTLPEALPRIPKPVV